MNRKYEIMAVKSLCESIGYGNVMDIAQALWSMKLSEDGIFRTGHIVAIEPYLKKKDAKEVIGQLKGRIGEIEWSLSHDEEITDVALRQWLD